MNPSSGDGWRGPPGPPAHHGSPENIPQQPARAFPGFGVGPQQQSAQSQGGPNVLLPPSYHPPGPPTGHNLPTLADINQNNQAIHHQNSQTVHHQPSPYNTHPPPPSNNHALPALGHALQPSPQAILNQEREREARERERRDMEMMERERQRQREEQHLREQEQINRERELAERAHREQMQHHPVQSHIGAIPMHQPVPTKYLNGSHGSSSLLSDLNTRAVPTNSSMTSSNGPVSIFSSGSQQQETTPRTSYLHASAPPSQQQPQQPQAITQPAAPQSMPGFGGPGPGPGPSPMPGHAAIGQQQPILNDALSYLDQVKVRFNDQPDVYNRFLDIMKDFKSQAIDTPGVIERVSNLFNGHPALIQGFNTFLPPGYRIECGTDDNPDAIRVTTPSGTTTQSLQARSRPGFEISNLSNSMGNSVMARQEHLDSTRQGWMQHQTQYSPNGRATNTGPYHQQQSAEPSYDNRLEQDAASAALVHQQEQHGVSQLQNAISAAANGATGRGPVLQVSPGPGQPASMVQQGGQGLLGVEMKRGPVEFNHAISYVNKIKNRFNQQPETYKQFLDILQTYQRESKPIQDVYAQVTQLFHTAPDLLEDFKQFLPESAAQAKAQAAARAAADEAMVSNVRGDYLSGQLVQAQTPRPSTKMPPMGQFDPPSTSKENKKRRGGLGQSANQSGSGNLDGLSNGQTGRNALQLGGMNKRTKVVHHKTLERDAPIISPTLVPQLPEPIPPQTFLAPAQDELSFFDRAKKFIANKNSFAEFLKVCNLFSQDLIDKNALAERANAFIGGSPDLITYFNRMLRIEPREEVFEAKAKPDTGRVNLAHCRSLGPSYRHLPKAEQYKLCRGRDEMCHQVLNNEWASHPTWASEDSGFVAHRKNSYEDGLHRVEEERHDYDFYIESCQRTVQLMEPLLQHIRLLSETDRAAYKIDEKLGGQSKAIPTRIINKIYGSQYGPEVMRDLLLSPIRVMPTVLGRLKQKLEEWKQSQREWEKVWREQTNRFFWKSLDHQGINAKTLDKKSFLSKTLTAEIQAKFDERKKLREAGYQQVHHQFEYGFTEQDVILDASHLILRTLAKDGSENAYGFEEQARINAFLTKFVTTFFEVDTDVFRDFMADVQDPDSNDDMEEDTNDEDVFQKRILKANKRKADILHRLALDKSAAKEASLLSRSRATTPVPGAPDQLSRTAVRDIASDVASRRWMDHPGSILGMNAREYNLDEPYERDEFNLYGNVNIYCLFRLFEMLYSRLVAIKEHEDAVHEDVRHAQGGRGQAPKPALTMRMMDKVPSDYFANTAASASYYRQIITMCEDAASAPNSAEGAHLEETLRRFYMKTGWQLYNVDKLINALTRFIANILSVDPKEKSEDIMTLFYKNREQGETTRDQERLYRGHVQRLVKEGDVYRIRYNPKTTKATIRLFQVDEETFSGETLDEEARWSVYVTAYQMLLPTEGVRHSAVRPTFLKRNLPPDFDLNGILSQDHQELRVDINTYRIVFTYNGVPGAPFVYRKKVTKNEMAMTEERVRKAKTERDAVMMEKFVNGNQWMEDEGEDAVKRRKDAWQEGLEKGLWLRDGFLDKANEAAAPVQSVEGMDTDV